MNQPRQFLFEWDELRASSNFQKHGVTFATAATIFHDPRILTVLDAEHSDLEERWLSIGLASNGILLSVAYMWQELSSATKIRLISARKAAQHEARYYEENL